MTMFAIALERAPLKLRGYLSRYMLQIRAGVFVADHNQGLRDRLWEQVVDGIKDGYAMMAYSGKTEGKMILREIGEDQRCLVVLDGLFLIASKASTDG